MKSQSELYDKYKNLTVGYLLQKVDKEIIKCYGNMTEPGDINLTEQEAEEARDWDIRYGRLLGLEEEILAFLDLLADKEVIRG